MDFIFGYGSIIEDSSRLSTLGVARSPPSADPQPTSGGGDQFSGGSGGCDKACAVRVRSGQTLKKKRTWSFRSPSGFTALGFTDEAELSDSDGVETKTFGIVFPIECEASLASFDLREKGYRRVLLPLTAVEVDVTVGCTAARQRALSLRKKIEEAVLKDSTTPIDSEEHLRMWTYVPDEEHTLGPDEEHPILQTYLDVCLRGCLAWGGRLLALEFIATTSGWSSFYLNDAPMSRRPWLHRTDYMRIDDCLESMSKACLFHERRHPEEFAAEHLSPLKGLWGVPPRNNQFVGRDQVISSLQEMILCDKCDISVAEKPDPDERGPAGVMEPGSHQVGIIGLGGVGKTQTAVEFVYRTFSEGQFGLVIWIRATGAADVAADLRRFAFDSGILRGATAAAPSAQSAEDESSTSPCNIDFDDDKIADEVRRKLSRSRCAWLVVLDNVEDSAVLSHYTRFLQPDTGNRDGKVKNGSDDPCFLGHILVTSRYLMPEWDKNGNTVVLDCFNVAESVLYIQNCLGLHNFNESPNTGGTKSKSPTARSLQRHLGSKNQNVYLDLALRMGCLPLALSMAAAYMRRCDVDVFEYVRRLDALDKKTEYVKVEVSDGRQLVSGTAISPSIGVSKVNDSIVSSLTISLDRIRVESDIASQLVPCLGFLYPDSVTKLFVEALVLSIENKTLVHRTDKSPRKRKGYLRAVAGSSASSYDTLLQAICRNRKLQIAVIQQNFEMKYWGVLGVPVLVSILFRWNFWIESTKFGIIFIVLCLLYFSARLFHFFRLSELCFTHERLGIGVEFCRFQEQALFPGTLSAMWNAFRGASPLYSVSTRCRTPCSFPDIPNDSRERISAERDSVWELLIQFSVMSVRGTRSKQRIGSIHRLQQSVIRSQCSRDKTARCLEYCIRACCYRWKFDNHKPDFSAWDNCGQILPHLDLLTRHVIKFMDMDQKIKLLKSGGDFVQSCMLEILNKKSVQPQDATIQPMCAYVSSVCSEVVQFGESTVLTYFRRDSDEDFESNRVPTSQLSPFLLNTVRWRYLLDLSHLCMQAGLYASVVLSKFDSAQLFLDMALDIVNYLGWALHTSPCSIMRNFPDNERALYVQTSSAILYHLGKTLRYNGLFEKAKEALTLSLNIRTQQGQVSLSVSDTLHELGVLNLKLHRLTDAEVLLTRSLRLKKQLKNIQSLKLASGHCVTTDVRGDTTEASTLHQLGVVSRAQGRYEEAEELLNMSLECADAAGNFDSCSHTGRLTSRAATIQQLGRISLRRGFLVKAQKLFNEALELYEHAYGDRHATTHINTIAVRHQLGNTAIADKRYGDACQHYSMCVSALETLYGESLDVWRRYDIVFELQSLGQAHSSKGEVDTAEAIFKRQIAVIRSILSAKYSYTADQYNADSGTGGYHTDDSIVEGSPDANTADSSINGTYIRRRTLLINSHLFAIYCLRSIEKQRNNGGEAAQYSKEAQYIRSLQKKLLKHEDADTVFALIYGANKISEGGAEAVMRNSGTRNPPKGSGGSAPTIIVESDSVGLARPTSVSALAPCTDALSKSVFKLEKQFKIGVASSEDHRFYDLLMDLLSIVVSMRCKVRNRCMCFSKLRKKTPVSGKMSLDMVERLCNSSRDIILCRDLIQKSLLLVEDNIVVIEGIIQSNGENDELIGERLSDVAALSSGVRKFADSVQSALLEVSGVDLVLPLVNGKETVDITGYVEKVENNQKAVSMCFQSCDVLRTELKDIGITVEDLG